MKIWLNVNQILYHKTGIYEIYARNYFDKTRNNHLLGGFFGLNHCILLNYFQLFKFHCI